ncbi:DVU_1557 family redox protein [Desulfofalx alkaliphila]|uniref:DVU_1557 family redox protein n=1 Tax=Desulfofalx alkaliphila TaxID=105483 RepID=UPI0004E1ACEA|nr:CLJU_RS11820 family redox protein [Desulfofalx alkaliphila]
MSIALDCMKCGVPMELGKVEVMYLNNKFPIELLKCPKCGMVFIPEELATGKMLEVEKALEDK